MMIYDRIYNTFVEEAKLPNHINLGRYLITETNEELCADNLPECDSSINDAFLGDTFSTTHKILRRLTQEINGVIPCKNNLPSPIIRDVCTEIKLTNFEDHLYEHINHIKAAFNSPHSKLNRIEEKVSVSKAKRITPRSYQHLGAHTEDWQQYSIVSFRPERVLTEELSQDYDIYENRLLVAFVQRTLAYLRGRLKAVEDAKEFIKEYRNSLQTYQKGLSDNSYWYAKPERNLKLYGREYHDQNYIAEGEDDESKSDMTYRKLHRMMNECVIMLAKNLAQEVNQRALETITYHDTNVLIGHPHYKYLKSLWADLNTEIQEFSVERIHVEHQDTIKGLASYANAIIKYIVAEYFHYTIYDSSENGWTAKYRENTYLVFPMISATSTKGVLELKVGTYLLRIVTIIGELRDTTLPSNCVVLKYNLRRYESIKSNIPNQIIDVNLKDVNSVERLSMFIRSVIIGLHIKAIMTNTTEPQSLDFLHPDVPVKMYDGNKNYLMMNDDFVLNISENDHSAIFSNANPRLKHLKFNDWGMDSIRISNYLLY